MLEEASAMHLLDVILPKILPSCVTFLCIPHRGRGDLQKSIPIKLRAWRTPDTFFVILHDQDSHDCKALKSYLQELCEASSQHNPLIRIVCRELEAWYFGDLDAVQKAFPKFNADKHRNKRRYKYPDAITKPSKELKKIVTGFSKGSAAREVPQYMDIGNNTSVSFNNTITGIKNLVGIT